ncbi:MAG: hypothetical protein MJ237_09440 [bacterium]|nr:hypothetical protein [bacterium]
MNITVKCIIHKLAHQEKIEDYQLRMFEQYGATLPGGNDKTELENAIRKYRSNNMPNKSTAFLENQKVGGYIS